MTDLEAIKAACKKVKNELTDKVTIIYAVKDLKEKDALEQVFKRVFEDNWGVYASKIKITG